MWKWSFKYENGTTTDTLYIPVNRPIKLNLNSIDVNHALFIPAFRVKKDVLPGQDRFAWFESNEVGSYNIMCAEYCGLNHSYMYSKVVVMPESEFKVWSDTVGRSSLKDSSVVVNAVSTDSLTVTKKIK
jgi:cytochrome c oxidase subunit 2